MANEEPTVLIIGAGTFGTSIAFHLAESYKDPSRVTVVDRWAPSSQNDKPSASYDTNRVVRTDYRTLTYSNLAFESIHPWFWNIHLQGHFHKTGWIALDEEGSDLSQSVREVFKSRGSDYTETIDLQALNAGKCNWGDVTKGTCVDGFSNAYFNPEAGWCNAACATAAYMQAAVDRGVNRITGEVDHLIFNQNNGGIEGVEMRDGKTLKAKKVVLAAGAWTSSLLSPIEEKIAANENIEQQVKAVGHVSAYYTLSDDEVRRFEQSKLPVICYGQLGEVIPPSSQNKTLKFNNSHTDIVNTITTKSGAKISVPPSTRSQLEVPEKLKRETEDLILSRLLPEFTRQRRPTHWRICYDAVTPTEDLLMCKHPNQQLNNLYLAVGGSFHSYKFLPVAGKYMINVLKGNTNGEEKDRIWGWKSAETLRQSERLYKGRERRELKDYEEGTKARL
ncbi:hypothetical protein M433DRAFT_132819 [Acidomyces richmondensis BFW]|nr:MAG: hypothetical protein FE78DRAFT_68042 [Acidomyces sp. 'richmondensis']KYG47631.1 hypothetical protein M433DRAFT_132819 [Acidomyces richmondensis BFW]